MDRRRALKIDTFFYSELDTETNLWCVFGDNTGFAYSSHGSDDEASQEAATMNQEYTESMELHSIQSRSVSHS